jgi:hypothetical protein
MRVLLAVLLLVGAVLPLHAPSLTAQSPEGDSLEILSHLKAEQERFERFRESRIPVSRAPQNTSCDARMGRICVWYGGADEANFPPEPVETGMARAELIGELADGLREVPHPWILGQLAHYLVEDGRMSEARARAESCGLTPADAWWCAALEGYVLHVNERFSQAEVRFREALDGMPADERARWSEPRFLLTQAASRELDALDAAEREARVELFWRLSDPLFLTEGNDRWTDHMARLVVARNRSEAANPYGLPWEEDLAESLIRYGRNIGYSRVQGPPPGMGPGGLNLQDSRRVVGHHHPGSRGYIFPEAFLEAPAEVPPESWVTAPREARSWYAPPYAPDLRALETQVARFRRGNELLVVGAYRPVPPELDRMARLAPDPEPEPWDPFRSPPPRTGGGDPAGGTPAAAGRGDADLDPATVLGPVEVGLFLIPEDGGEVLAVRGTDPSGVLTLRAPAGRWVSSLEVLEPQRRRAWRARQGVVQPLVEPGTVAVSDLLLLRPDAPFPETVDDAIAHARPGIRVRADEAFTVAWETYGLQVDEEVRITMGFTSGRPGFLTRVGEFLGILEPDRPVEVTFTAAGPTEVQTLFRAMVLDLPDLEPGEYTLHLRAELAGQEPAIASRPITVTP